MPDTQRIQQRIRREQAIPDGTLIKLALAGDQSAFDLLVHRYRNVLVSYIRRFFRDSDMVYDVLQHVLIQLHRSLPVLATNVSLHAWLFQVAHNRCLDELRRMRKHVVIPFSRFEWEDEEEELPIVAALPDPAPLPEEVVEMRERYGSLHEAIASLPPKFRSIVLLHSFRQLSFTEIGRLLHLPASTVKRYFYRALPLLRKVLAADARFVTVS